MKDAANGKPAPFNELSVLEVVKSWSTKIHQTAHTTPMSEQRTQSSAQTDQTPAPKTPTRNHSVDWAARNAFPKGVLNALARVSLAIEKPISRWVREGKFNPLYHTGTITVFLFVIILGTGVYLTMFYQFGFEAAYQAVADIEANFIGRIIRALHRYASGAAVIFALLHGWRTFFQDRFRGPRWLAWSTGIGMAAVVWLIGISGYWLIWDERAAVLNQTLINLLNGSQLGTNFLLRYLVSARAGTGWIFLVLVLTVHLGLSAVVGLFYWWHIQRLSRAKWLPPNYWMIAITGLLVLAAILLPVGMLGPIDPNRLPGQISIDAFYLFYLPGALNWPALFFWGAVLLLIGLAAALPWLLTRKKHPSVVVNPDRCTGCTLCAADCPYTAIQMIDRPDDKQHKYLAEIDPKLCVACGICIGTCAPLALTLGQQPAEPLWEETLARISERVADPVKVVFTCERHAAQGAQDFLNFSDKSPHPRSASNPLTRSRGEQGVYIVPLTCVGMAHPDLAVKALEAGAAAVHFIGCPPEDCANREGNLWLQERLDRDRLPKLKSKYAEAPIFADWLPPDDFGQALAQPNTQKEATGYKFDLGQIKWPNFIPAIILLALVFILQIWLSDIRYQPYPMDTARLEITLDHRAGYPLKETATHLEPALGLAHPTRLILKIDDQIIFDKSYPPQGSARKSLAFEQIPLKTGKYHVQLTMFDRPQQAEGLVLYDQLVELTAYEVRRLNYTSQKLGGDPLAGEKIFNNRSIGAGGSCSLCHALEPGRVLVGPSLAGIATQAEERVPGMSAETYLRESILTPDAHVVTGFPAGQMLPDLAEKLSPEQIDDLVAFLLTMK